jgi:hypothetical protein
MAAERDWTWQFCPTRMPVGRDVGSSRMVRFVGVPRHTEHIDHIAIAYPNMGTW